jgi:hypothetical protein
MLVAVHSFCLRLGADYAADVVAFVSRLLISEVSEGWVNLSNCSATVITMADAVTRRLHERDR